MNRFLERAIYNVKLKEKFLKRYKVNTRNVYKNVFRKTYKQEYRLRKDLSLFTKEELELVMKNFKAGTMKGIKEQVAVMSKYVNFCKKDNNLDKLKEKELGKYIVNVDVNVLSATEVDDIIRRCDNAQDSLVFALLFQGLTVKEITKLKVSDVEGYALKLEKRDIRVTKSTIDIIDSAIKQKIYIKKDARYNAAIKETDLILRSSAKVTNRLVYDRVKLVVKTLRPSDVRRAGMVCMYRKGLSVEKISQRFTETREKLCILFNHVL